MKYKEWVDTVHIPKKQIMGLYRTMPLYIKMPKDYFDDEGNAAFLRLKNVYLKNYA